MSEILNRLADIIESRKLVNGGDPEKSYGRAFLPRVMMRSSRKSARKLLKP